MVANMMMHCSTECHIKFTDQLFWQEDAFNQLRQSAIDLRNFLQDGYYNVSAGCIAFLQDMINGAPELVKVNYFLYTLRLN